GLTTGKTYTYVVSAYFTLGSSPISNDASAKPETTSVPPASQTTLNPPGAPTGLSTSPITPTIVNLSWTSPSNTGGAAITGYKIEVKKGTGAYETLASGTNATTKYSHTGLTTGTTYTYRVYAINSVGIGPASAESSATPVMNSSQPPTTASKPGAPTLSGTRISPTQINLSWSAPSNDGGATITGYKIEYKIGTNSYLTLTNKAVGTTYSHTGLLSNTYSYRVYAINSAGIGAPSNEISIQTQAPPKEEPETETPPVEEPPKLASFVDPKKDPMHYVNRYNNEPVYKDWFDRNFPEMTIYEAVGLPNPEDEVPDFEPPPPESIKTRFASFVDPKQDPMHYVNRYNSEIPYKNWFDATFPGESIYEAVGLPDPSKQNNTSQCGPGTHLEDGMCVLDEKGGGCLIATAAYGTEMAPQVQMLREIRDNVLFGTSSGTAFMTGFNSFYYSFSPSVANLERQNSVFKEAIRVALTPMLSTLSILNYVDIDSEYEMLGYGMGLILLNAGMYLGVPAFAIVAIRKHFRQ
ncbi:MAG: fibronectin type III domain-containing protein, partial [Candidatus Nitrosotenuis sp.]|nr:fibronectin type III domain-containing protein [Candidatus Nitrosotenuis sp.]